MKINKSNKYITVCAYDGAYGKYDDIKYIKEDN